MSVREGAKWYAKGWGIAILAVVTILLFSTGVMFATGSIQKWTADWRGDVKAKEQTKANGAFRVGTYNDFWNLCSAVQSDEDSIRNAEEEMNAKETTADRKAKLRQIITATKNTRAENVRDYNVKAQNEYKAAFQDTDLPYALNINNYSTECGPGPSAG